MATPSGQFHPWRHIWTFVGIVVVLYALVVFTPGSNSPKLGIDLQGGTRITLTAHTEDGTAPSSASMSQARDIMERRVNGSGVAGAQVQIEGSSNLVITVPGNQDLTDLTRSARLNIRPVIGQAIPVAVPTTTAPGTTGATTSGTGAPTGSPTSAPTTAPAIGETKTPTPTATAAPKTSPNGLRNAAAAATEPVAPISGTTAPSTAATPTTAGTPTTTAGTTAAAKAAFPAGSDPKNPTQPAGTDATAWTTWETAAATNIQAGKITCADLVPYLGLDDPNRPLLSCTDDGTAMYVLDKTLIPGTQISTATANIDSNSGAWVVNLSFKSEGYATWSKYTTANVGKQTAFTLDGEVLSAPVIQEAITTPGTMVSGSFTQQSATALANSLKFGALPLAFTRAESENVSAELGSQYLEASLIAGGIGLLLVIIYCLVYYRLLGLITIGSLILSGLLIYAIMVLLGRWIGLSLDMAGVAGLIIAIGITADSFVVYFERIKDEVREGKTFRSAVPRGWSRAKRTILSADAVTFLSAAILYIIAVGDVKGFAFTLGLSTVLDLAVVFLVTHPLVSLVIGSKAFASPWLSGLGSVADAGRRQRATAQLAAKEA